MKKHIRIPMDSEVLRDVHLDMHEVYKQYPSQSDYLATRRDEFYEKLRQCGILPDRPFEISPSPISLSYEVTQDEDEEKDPIVFVNEEMFKMIADELGYRPDNLRINELLEDNTAVVMPDITYFHVPVRSVLPDETTNEQVFAINGHLPKFKKLPITPNV